MDELLESTNEALHWVKVSLLQAKRFLDSFLDYAEDNSDATAVNGDAHFLLNSCAQAEKALERAGHTMSAEQRTTIRSLRNVHEHWEQHKKSFESKHSPKTRAGLRFSSEHPDHLPWAFRIDATGTYISALRLEDLWDELVGLERELTDKLSEMTKDTGLPPLQVPNRGQLPRRESNVLGFAVLMQNIVLDFDEPAEGSPER